MIFRECAIPTVITEYRYNDIPVQICLKASQWWGKERDRAKENVTETEQRKMAVTGAESPNLPIHRTAFFGAKQIF